MPTERKFTLRQNGATASILCAGLALGCGLAAIPETAQAQTIVAQIGVASEYVGKGLGKSDGDPSVNASVEVSHGDVYANVFVSTAKLSQGSDAEIVSTVGWRPEAAGYSFDFSATNRDLPGTRAGIDANFWEYQASIGRQLGPVNAKARISYSPDSFAATREAWWYELVGTVSAGPKTKISASIADRTADGGAEYAAWNVGVKHKLTQKLAMDVRWYDTDSHAYGENYEGRLVGALTYQF